MPHGIRPYDPDRDEAWAAAFLEVRLGGRWQARRGELIDVLAPGLGLVAEVDARPVGLLTYRLEGQPDAIELSAIAVETGHRRRGMGTTLVEALVTLGAGTGRPRIRVVTTNDNLEALRLYQRRGFRLVELRRGAVDVARRGLKPSIPVVGAHGLPLSDELELEYSVPAAIDRPD